ncbi:MAG: hypothetical protein AAGH41_04020 [Pseudomonadota bacterium]
MTDSPETPIPGPSVAVAKGIALGMGVLLIAGTLLLITMLVTRAPSAEPVTSFAVSLQAGEKVTDVSLFEGQALFVIEDAAGEQRIVLLNLGTGEESPVALRTR